MEREQDSADRPGGGTALLAGCSCEFAENRGGRGVGGIVVGVDPDGVARRIAQPVYLVREGCPVHAPRRPWWALPGLFMAGAGTSFAVSISLSSIWSSTASSWTGFGAGIVAALLCARWYTTTALGDADEAPNAGRGVRPRPLYQLPGPVS